MEWEIVLQIIAIIGGVATVFGLFLAPMFWLGSKIDTINTSLNTKIDNLRSEIHEEMKDFHGRLCAIEERRGK